MGGPDVRPARGPGALGLPAARGARGRGRPGAGARPVMLRGSRAPCGPTPRTSGARVGGWFRPGASAAPDRRASGCRCRGVWSGRHSGALWRSWRVRRSGGAASRGAAPGSPPAPHPPMLGSSGRPRGAARLQKQ
ncbi:MAG: hypothetical protein D6708_02625 [Candidatus Dadabacteria bacterium]|nr:MAG: hypothetical protein D6708_02625 [Candidatus Dadabacteria bacterium]